MKYIGYIAGFLFIIIGIIMIYITIRFSMMYGEDLILLASFYVSLFISLLVILLGFMFLSNKK